jgi:hypothetical protein
MRTLETTPPCRPPVERFVDDKPYRVDPDKSGCEEEAFAKTALNARLHLRAVPKTLYLPESATVVSCRVRRR